MASKSRPHYGTTLARRLQYSKTKGGRHENQDECEGWSQSSDVGKCDRRHQRLHKFRAKGGSHENQDECEGWSQSDVSKCDGQHQGSTNPGGKEKVMKTKTNVKAGMKQL
jgi:hypothetical protein